MSTPEPIIPTTPIENVPRGTLLALLIIPAGIIVWVIVWSIGFIVSLIGLGIALGGMALYRFGSGGMISRVGAVRVTIITIVTIVLSILAGLISDVLPAYVNHYHVNPVAALTSPQFWDVFGRITTDPETIGGVGLNVILALAFGVLGCFSVLRTAFVQTRNASAMSSAAAGYGQPVPNNPYTVAPPTAPAAPATPAATANAADGTPSEAQTTDPDSDAKR